MDRNIVLKVRCEKEYSTRTTMIKAAIYFTSPKPTRYETNAISLDEEVPPDYALASLSEHLFDKLKETFTDEEIIEQLSTLHPPVAVRTVPPRPLSPGILGGYSGPLPASPYTTGKWSKELEQEWLTLCGTKAAIASGFHQEYGSSPLNAGSDDSGTSTGT